MIRSFINLIAQDLKKLLLSSIIYFSLVIAILLILPKSFISSAVIMQPVDDNNIGLASAISNLPFGNLLGAESNNETNRISSIISSRTLKEEMISEFNVMEQGEIEYIEDALEAVGGMISHEVLPEGTIKINCVTTTEWFHPQADEDSCKQTSNEMVSFVLSKVDSLNKYYKSERASYHRIVVENRYFQNISDLASAENALLLYQQRYKTIAFEDQVRASIDSYATLKAEYLRKDIEYNVLRRSIPDRDPQLVQLGIELEEMNQKIIHIENADDYESQYLPGLETIPERALEFIRLKRDVEVQTILYKYMVQQYEEAKLQETKNSPTIQVLDFPNTPQKKYGPPRMKYMFVFGMLYVSVILGVYYKRVEKLHLYS